MARVENHRSLLLCHRQGPGSTAGALQGSGVTVRAGSGRRPRPRSWGCSSGAGGENCAFWVRGREQENRAGAEALGNADAEGVRPGALMGLLSSGTC